jgi:DNA-binding response OmpR family regulator
LHVTCSSCGMRLQNTWHICPQCGTAAKRAPASGSSAPSTASAPTGVPEPRRYRALVVDDQADFRRLITFTLEHSCLPISAVAVGSGPEAIAHAQDEPPDLVVLDIMMPEMDGFEVCERLRASVRTAFVPILMLTALDDTANRARGFLAGTDDYIGKPFARAEFLARVRRLLERTYGASLPPEATGAGGVLERPRPEVSAI